VSYPENSTARIYQDSDGNDITLYNLVRLEPDWAVSRIQHMNKEVSGLKAQLANITSELSAANENLDQTSEELDQALTQLANSIPKERIEALIERNSKLLSYCTSDDLILECNFKAILNALTPLLINQPINQGEG